MTKNLSEFSLNAFKVGLSDCICEFERRTKKSFIVLARSLTQPHGTVVRLTLYRVSQICSRAMHFLLINFFLVIVHENSCVTTECKVVTI